MSRIRIQKELRRGRMADRMSFWLFVLLVTVLVVSVVQGLRMLPYTG
jgi:hypothetical protein